jgi:hypothetical protein
VGTSQPSSTQPCLLACLPPSEIDPVATIYSRAKVPHRLPRSPASSPPLPKRVAAPPFPLPISPICSRNNRFQCHPPAVDGHPPGALPSSPPIPIKGVTPQLHFTSSEASPISRLPHSYTAPHQMCRPSLFLSTTRSARPPDLATGDHPYDLL